MENPELRPGFPPGLGGGRPFTLNLKTTQNVKKLSLSLMKHVACISQQNRGRGDEVPPLVANIRKDYPGEARRQPTGRGAGRGKAEGLPPNGTDVLQKCIYIPHKISLYQ